MIIHDHPDRETLARLVAEEIAGTLRESLETRGRATVAVPGGTTPGPVIAHLGAARLHWPNVVILPGDERWVPQTDERSNERLIRECLRGTAAERAVIQSLYDGSDSPETGARNLNPRIARLLPLDVCLLGMGADGHTASLFPDAPELSDALSPTPERPLVATHPASMPEARITFSGPALFDSRRLMLIITGAEKIDVLDKAMEPGPIEEMPIRFMLGREDIEVHRAP